MNPQAFRAKLKEKLRLNRLAFEGQYKEALNELMGLSRADIGKITPDGAGLETYDRLITLVKEASQHNVSQAELKENIEELGEVAVDIAKLVPRLGL